MAKSAGYMRRYRANNVKNQLAGNKVDLDYARMMYKQYAHMANYTIKAYKTMDEWSREVKRLEAEREKLLKKQKKRQK